MSDTTNQLLNHYLGKPIESPTDILEDKPGLTDLLASALYSGMARWLMLANLLVVVFTGLLIWSAIKFFTGEQVEDYVFWGVCVILSLQVQVALKQWIWSQLDRGSVIRELKRTQRLLLKVDTASPEK